MITQVFGKPRIGKTAFMVADMVPYLNRSEQDLDLYQTCCNEIKGINTSGNWGFDFPEHSPVYSNFQMLVQTGYQQYTGSYYMDGYHMGFENPYVPVLPVLPWSKIYLSEAQRYYDSRKKGGIPDWVSRFFEESGHFYLDFMLDMQRPALIDLNVRENASRFIYIERMENFTDNVGNIVASRWYFKEFDDWKYAEKFIDSGETSHCQNKTKDFVGNVFECYQSRCYRDQFLPIKRHFSMLQHIYGVRNDEELQNYKFMYSQSAPAGYWPGENKGK